MVAAEEVDGAVLVGERHRLLGRERERVGVGVVLQVAARGLAPSPLAHVALANAAALGDLGRGQRPGPGHRLPQPQLAADHHQDAVHRRAHVGHRLAEELLELASSKDGVSVLPMRTTPLILGAPGVGSRLERHVSGIHRLYSRSPTRVKGNICRRRRRTRARPTGAGGVGLRRSGSRPAPRR